MPRTGLARGVRPSSDGARFDEPVIANPGTLSNYVGDVVNLPLQATDAGGGTLSYSDRPHYPKA